MTPVTVRWGAVVALVAYSVVVVQVGLHSPFPTLSLATAVLAALAGLVAFGAVYGLYRLFGALIGGADAPE